MNIGGKSFADPLLLVVILRLRCVSKYVERRTERAVRGSVWGTIASMEDEGGVCPTDQDSRIRYRADDGGSVIVVGPETTAGKNRSVRTVRSFRRLDDVFCQFGDPSQHVRCSECRVRTIHIGL